MGSEAALGSQKMPGALLVWSQVLTAENLVACAGLLVVDENFPSAKEPHKGALMAACTAPLGFKLSGYCGGK